VSVLRCFRITQDLAMIPTIDHVVHDDSHGRRAFFYFL